MKRIAFIAHLSEVSGSGVALLANAVAFRDMGYTVFVVLPGEGDLHTRATKLGFDPVVIRATEVAITEVSALKATSVLGNRMKYVNHLRRFLQGKKVDLAYINSSANIFPGLAAKLAGCSIVWHIHETINLKSGRAVWKKRLIQNLADGLIFASQSGVKAFKPADKVPNTIALNMVQTEELSSVRMKRKAEYALPTEQPHQSRIFMAGTVPAKGADLLLDSLKFAAKFLPMNHLEVAIAGMQPTNEYRLALMTSAKSAGLDGRVHLIGLVDSLAPELARADLFVSPSRNEALPISIVEAMAAGVPVVATDVGDCADLLEHGRCGWVVPPEDPEALSSAITEALNNCELAQQKADAAFEKVQTLYGNADFWQPLERFLLEIIARR